MKVIKPGDFYEKTKKQLLAIDIGAKGGAVWNVKGQLYTDRSTNGLESIMNIFNQVEPDIIVAENVHPWGGQGVNSAGTLMQARGRWEGIAWGFDKKQITFIQPEDWIKCYTIRTKKEFKDTKHWKDHLIGIANCVQRILKLETSGEADAWMIWNYYAHIIVNDRMRPIGEFQFS